MSDQVAPSYTVVARRYRPQAFAELVGQPHVITALSNAIEQHRVGHAYLFTGARGVGKTSTARIFAKCLNCVEGPTTTPCNECDVCKSVSVGEDIDVLEIDGASNRGIEEIRQLRSNVNIRPSRCRYKIYIIDEVHMLTTPAFNALLKTLEEPPSHVKFIFCTTDPHKIPITVLSRCQRFDFSPVEADDICGKLREIAQAEGVAADEGALELIARRANGSMRDSQSLLEQILSFCDQQIRVEDVYQLLGTADMGRVTSIVTAIVSKDLAGVLGEIEGTLKTGVDIGQLAQQLVGYLRDMMATKAGCEPKFLINVAGLEIEPMTELTTRVDLQTILAMIQLIDQAVTRMQHSHHSRVLLEAAALRCCELENLQAIADLLAGVAPSAISPAAAPNPPAQRPNPGPVSTPPSSDAAKKKTDVAPTLEKQQPEKSQPVSAPVVEKPSATAVESPVVADDVSSLSATDSSRPVDHPEPASSMPDTGSQVSSSPVAVEAPSSEQATATAEPVAGLTLEAAWKRALELVGSLTADMASDYQSIRAVDGTQRLQVLLGESYHAKMCNQADRRLKFEEAMSEVLGHRTTLEFITTQTREDQAHEAPRKLSRRERMQAASEIPFVKSALHIFNAEVTDVSDASIKTPR